MQYQVTDIESAIEYENDLVWFWIGSHGGRFALMQIELNLERLTDLFGEDDDADHGSSGIDAHPGHFDQSRLDRIQTEQGLHRVNSSSDVRFCNPLGSTVEDVLPLYTDMHRARLRGDQRVVFFQPRANPRMRTPGESSSLGGNLPTFSNLSLDNLNILNIRTHGPRVDFGSQETFATWASRSPQVATANPNIEGQSLYVSFCRSRLGSDGQVLTESSPLADSALYFYSRNLALNHSASSPQSYDIIVNPPLTSDEVMNLVVGNLNDSRYSTQKVIGTDRYQLSITGDWHIANQLTRFLESDVGKQRFPNTSANPHRRQDIINAINAAVLESRSREHTTNFQDTHVEHQWYMQILQVFGLGILGTLGTFLYQRYQFTKTMEFQEKTFQTQLKAMNRQMIMMEESFELSRRQLDGDQNRDVLGMGTNMIELINDTAERRRLNDDAGITARVDAAQAALTRLTEMPREDRPADYAAQLRTATTNLRHLQNLRTANFERPVVTPVLSRAVNEILTSMINEKATCPLLTGPAGSGKTTAIQLLAYILSGGDIDPAWGLVIPREVQERIDRHGYRLISLEPSAIMAGTRYRGDLEERVRNLMAEMDVDARNNIEDIVFIDEIHTLGSEVRNLIKARTGGDTNGWRIMGATTVEEVGQFYNLPGTNRRDPALVRRFPNIGVSAENDVGVRRILTTINNTRRERNKISLDNSLVQRVADTSMSLIQGQNAGEVGQPVTGINLLNRILADAKANRDNPASPYHGNRTVGETELNEILESYTRNDRRLIAEGYLEEVRRAQELTPEQIQAAQTESIGLYIQDVVGRQIWETSIPAAREAWINLVKSSWHRAAGMTRTFHREESSRRGYQVSQDLNAIPRTFAEMIISDLRDRDQSFSPVRSAPTAPVSERQIDETAARSMIRQVLGGRAGSAERRFFDSSAAWRQFRRTSDQVQQLQEIQYQVIMSQLVLDEWRKDGYPLGRNNNPNLPDATYFGRAEVEFRVAVQRGDLYQENGGEWRVRARTDPAHPYRTAGVQSTPRVPQFNPTGQSSPWEADPALLQIRIDDTIIRRSLEGTVRSTYEDELALEPIETVEDLVRAIRHAYHDRPQEAERILEESYQQARPSGSTTTPSWGRVVSSMLGRIAIERGLETRSLTEVASELERRVDARRVDVETRVRERAERAARVPGRP
ncbi:MAG: AAA family ATPase [Deltaproteobacteria bacterium]|nr:MAG: AAA family ATPase [Deltaproteobacteria bacterium]